MCEDQEEAGQRLEESLQYGAAITQLIAAGAELVFNCPALGDIANGAGNQYAFLGLQRAKADLSRELGSILT